MHVLINMYIEPVLQIKCIVIKRLEQLTYPDNPDNPCQRLYPNLLNGYNLYNTKWPRKPGDVKNDLKKCAYLINL